jgi:hypothetical protein
MLVNLLILFFLTLILYQIFLAHLNFIEGMNSYQDYDTNNPLNALILSQKNAGNIEFLKSRVDELSNINKEVLDISMNVAQLNSQMNQIAKNQADAATSLVGSTPPKISGTTTSVADNVV